VPEYEWKHVETEEVVTVTRKLADYQVPPDDSGKWVRVYSVGIGRVDGAAGDKARPSVRRKNRVR
jgi:hypothetical protein